MRTFEIILLLANLLTFLIHTIPQSHAMRWTGYSSIAGLLIAGAQALVEGFRWQMIPAYLLSGLFFSFWLLTLL